MDEVELRRQLSDLRKSHKDLYLSPDKKSVRGRIYIEYDDEKNNFDINIAIADSYPSQIPEVEEISNKTPKNYHKFEDGTLCLETRYNIFETFSRDRTLVNFVDNLIVPYFAGWMYLAKHGRPKIAEHAHGAEGLANDYMKRLNAKSLFELIKLLKFLAVDFCYEQEMCPCGSGIRGTKCHGLQLRLMHESGYNFLADYCDILIWFRDRYSFNINSFENSAWFRAIFKIRYNG